MIDGLRLIFDKNIRCFFELWCIRPLSSFLGARARLPGKYSTLTVGLESCSISDSFERGVVEVSYRVKQG